MPKGNRASLCLQSRTRAIHVPDDCAWSMTAQPIDLPDCTLGWVMTDEWCKSPEGPFLSFCWPPRRDCKSCNTACMAGGGVGANKYGIWLFQGRVGPQLSNKTHFRPHKPHSLAWLPPRCPSSSLLLGRTAHVSKPLLASHMAVLPAGQAQLTMEHQSAFYRTSCIQ